MKEMLFLLDFGYHIDVFKYELVCTSEGVDCEDQQIDWAIFLDSDLFVVVVDD